MIAGTGQGAPPRGRLPAVMLGLLGGLAGGAAAAQPAPAAAPGLEFNIVPYLWAPSVKGNLRFVGPPEFYGAEQAAASKARSASVGVDATQLLGALEAAATIAAEIRLDRYLFMTDLLHLGLGHAESRVRSFDAPQLGRSGLAAELNAGTQTSLRTTLFSAAGGYRLAAGSWGNVDAFAGIRTLSVSARTDVRLAADLLGAGGGIAIARAARFSRSDTLVDGIAGVRGRFEVGHGFHLPYAFDIGGGASTLTWQALGGVGYQTGWAGVTLGYRHLSYAQGGHGLVQDLSLGGPFLALNLTF